MVQRLARGPSALSLGLAFLFLVGACSSAPAPSTSATGSAGPPVGSTPTSGGVAAAAAILNAARVADPDSLAALEGIRFSAEGTQAAADLLRAGATGDALWAATYVYGSSGSDPAPLRAVATDASTTATIRAMAAAGLLGRGDVAGFEPLITGLTGNDQMDGAEPAGTVWEFAAQVLERYTHQGFGPTLVASDAERTTIQARWKSWLDANRATLRFDAASKLWVTA